MNYRSTGGGPGMADGVYVHTDYIKDFYQTASRSRRYLLILNTLLSAGFGVGIGPVTNT